MVDCEEIQGLWQPLNGDFYTFMYEREKYQRKKGFDENDERQILGTWQHYRSFADGSLQKRIMDNKTWLPRQDQLQEMVKPKPDYPFAYIICDFVKYYENRGETEFNACSMEQWWLCFYMKEKHNKTWNGTEWERIDKEFQETLMNTNITGK